jgi:hypothetical protein
METTFPLELATRKFSPQGYGPEVIRNSRPDPSARVDFPDADYTQNGQDLRGQ